MAYIGKHRAAWSVYDPYTGTTMATTTDERFACRLAMTLGYAYAPTGAEWV